MPTVHLALRTGLNEYDQLACGADVGSSVTRPAEITCRECIAAVKNLRNDMEWPQ